MKRKTELIVLLIVLTFVEFTELIGRFFSNLLNLFRFEKQQLKKHLYFSKKLFGVRNDCIDRPATHSEVESTVDNIRYDIGSDTWEEFHVHHRDDRPPGIECHEGFFGYWIIIDDVGYISSLEHQHSIKLNEVRLTLNPT